MKKVCLLALLCLFFLACEKKNMNPTLKGEYTGTFRTIQQGKMVMSDFDISISDDSFKVKKGSKMGSGSYRTGSNNQVIFQDENAWTAEFDWNLILSGEYTYQTKGDSLILTRNLKLGGPLELTVYNYYQYRLKKQTN